MSEDIRLTVDISLDSASLLASDMSPWQTKHAASCGLTPTKADLLAALLA